MITKILTAFDVSIEFSPFRPMFLIILWSIEIGVQSGFVKTVKQVMSLLRRPRSTIKTYKQRPLTVICKQNLPSTTPQIEFWPDMISWK